MAKTTSDRQKPLSANPALPCQSKQRADSVVKGQTQVRLPKPMKCSAKNSTRQISRTPAERARAKGGNQRLTSSVKPRQVDQQQRQSCRQVNQVHASPPVLFSVLFHQVFLGASPDSIIICEPAAELFPTVLPEGFPYITAADLTADQSRPAARRRWSRPFQTM